jgi:hypothetical protein
MNNVVSLQAEARRKRNVKTDPYAALTNLARKVALMAHMPMATKEEMQRSIVLIGLSHTRVREFIGLIEDDETRTHLFAHADRIGELIEITRLKAAAL